jgi:prepilin peptidase CpaA
METVMFSSPANWPVVFLCAAMIASAVIDWWKFRVPNWLTFPVILSGWLLGLVHTLGWHPDAGLGGVGDVLLGTALGFACLIPMYAIGGMGAGDVKMTMGFGSWIGAFFGLSEGLWIILYAFCAGTIVGGIIAMGMIIIRGNYRQNVSHVREIVGDMFQTNVGEMAGRANRRRPRWHRLPYGVPLCIGFLGSLIYLYGF